MAVGGKKVKGAAKKKGKKGKAKDTAELELEQLKEEEEAKKTLERKLRLQLEEEMKMSRVNALKVSRNWRAILRKRKADELRKEIDVLAQDHERQVDRKDAVIQMLMKDIDVAEEQFRLALRSHLQNVDELIRLQQSRVRALAAEFEKDIHIIEDEFTREKKEILKRHEEEKKEIQDIIESVKRDAEEKDEEIEQEFSSKNDEIISKNNETYNVLRITLENVVDTYTSKINEEHEKYVSSTEQLMNKYQMLTDEDEATVSKIAQQMKSIQRLQESVAFWKAKLANNIREGEERNKTLRIEKESLSKHFKELKKKMNAFRTSEEKRLAELVQNSSRTISTLKQRLEQAERILKLAELNRKLETEREKILPFYESSTTEEEEELQQQELLDEAPSPRSEFSELQLAVEEQKLMENFYKRYNKVLLDKVAIQKEKDHLTDENQKLRSLLKQYLDGISVNEDVLATQNPLMITHEMQQSPAHMKTKQHRATVEASQVVLQYNKSGY